MSARLRLFVAIAGLIFFAAHAHRLPPTLEDIDSINFALGVEHFDVANHRPHPPGYPVYIALAKISTAAVDALAPASWSRSARAAAGLSLISVIAGALAIWALTEFWLACGLTPAIAFLAALVAAASPLFWFTAARPLSDTPGLVAAVGVAAGFLRGWHAWRLDRSRCPRAWIWSAIAAGVIIGLRTQTMWMTGPLWCCAVAALVRAGRTRDAGVVVGAAAAGALVWAVPLVIASGGLGAYLHALRSQGAEDFSGIEMLAGRPSVALLRAAIHRTFVDGWAVRGLANAFLGLGVLGVARLAWRGRRTLALVLLTFLPYLIFHLAFQETATLRYDLPIVVAVAGLATVALAALGTKVATVGAAALAVASLVIVQPRVQAYSASGAPVFRALDDMAHQAPSLAQPAELDMHIQVWFGARRATDWIRPEWDMGPLPRPIDREWLQVVEHWRAGRTDPVWFLSELTRNDLRQFDPRATRLVRRYEQPAEIRALVGNSRLDSLAWWALDRPAWMLGRGWALTPEVAGMTNVDLSGPPFNPAEAFLMRTPTPLRVMIGGRDLSPAGSADGLLITELDGRPLRQRRLTSAQPWFVEWIDLPDGVPDGPGPYARLLVRVVAADPGQRPPAAGLEQFDAAPASTPMFSFDEGWNELEENPSTGQLWRWTSAASTINVRGGGDLVLTLAGESPLKNFSQPPVVVVRAGSVELARFSPANDFTQRIPVPAAALAAADGRLTITTDKTFSPADLGQGADHRTLGLRLFAVTIDPK